MQIERQKAGELYFSLFKIFFPMGELFQLYWLNLLSLSTHADKLLRKLWKYFNFKVQMSSRTMLS